MSTTGYDQQLIEGAYALGRHCSQLTSERRKLARQLRYTRHAARLMSISKQYDCGMVFFATLGAVSLILSGMNSHSDAWLFTTLSVSLMLVACATALKGRKMVRRIRSFHDRFGSQQL